MKGLLTSYNFVSTFCAHRDQKERKEEDKEKEEKEEDNNYNVNNNRICPSDSQS